MHATSRGPARVRSASSSGGASDPTRDRQAIGGSAMFVVLLKFADNKGKAGQFMEKHKAWLQRGFDDGIFLLAGNLQPSLGGGIVAHNSSMPDLQDRVNADPFVAEGIVSAEILEISPSRVDDRLKSILA